MLSTKNATPISTQKEAANQWTSNRNAQKAERRKMAWSIVHDKTDDGIMYQINAYLNDPFYKAVNKDGSFRKQARHIYVSVPTILFKDVKKILRAKNKNFRVKRRKKHTDGTTGMRVYF